MNLLEQLGAAAAGLLGTLTRACDFIGRCEIAVPKAVAAPRSVGGSSLPQLDREIGADTMLVTSATNVVVTPSLERAQASVMGPLTPRVAKILEPPANLP